MSVIPTFLFVTSMPSVRIPSVLTTAHAKLVLLVTGNVAMVSKINCIHRVVSEQEIEKKH